ncbi:MAG: SIMPL domain-containing protein, partial [Spirochaetales bacterium]
YEKAQLYAKQAGLEVSRPISINEGYTSYATANYKRAYAEDSMVVMAAEGAAATYSTQAPTGLLSASVDVNITFELK